MHKYKEQNLLYRKCNKGQVVEEHILVQSLLDKQLYVLKKTDISKMGQDKAMQLEKHLQHLLKLQHPSLLQIKEFFRDSHFMIQILEYCGEQTLHERLSKKVSVNLVTQYLLQLLFALHYLEMQNIHVTLDMETIFLNSFGSLRIQFDLLSNKNWKDEVKQLQTILRKANLDWESQQSHELQQIMRQLMQPDPPSVQQMINHPYLLKAMLDFCKHQEQESIAKKNQDKLIQKKARPRASSSSNIQRKQQLPSPAHQRKNSKDKILHPHPPLSAPAKKKQEIQQKIEKISENKNTQNQNCVPPKKRNNSQEIQPQQQFTETKGQQELEELLALYRNQLQESSKHGYNPWLNMSEIKELTEYDSTVNKDSMLNL